MIAYWPKEVYNNIPEFAFQWISRALEHANGERSLEDVKAELESGSKQLWLHTTDDIFDFCIVTHIIEHPDKKTCEIVYSGGVGMLASLGELTEIEDWARLQGCTDIQAIGRKYMIKSLAPYGYDQRYVTVGKNL